MSFITYLGCCGLQEIASVYDSTPSQVVRSLGRGSCGAYIFSTNNTNERAHELAKFVESRKLGEIIKIPDFINPNTSRRISAYVWVVDRVALANYANKHNGSAFKSKRSL